MPFFHRTVIIDLVLSVKVRDSGRSESSRSLDSIRGLVWDDRLIAFYLEFC
jgi:hypothetical protein